MSKEKDWVPAAHPEKTRWGTLITFGKYKGETLLNTWIQDKNYFKWLFENELFNKYPEIDWLYQNITAKERRELGF